MVKGLKIDFKQTGTIAAVVTASVLAVSWLFSTFLKTTVEPLFAAVPVVSAVTGTIGEKVVGLVSGVLPIGDFFGLMPLLTLYISAFVVIIAGEYFIDNLKIPMLKVGMSPRVSRLAHTIVYGAIPAYLILVGFTFPGLMTSIGVIIHAVATAIVAITISKLIPALKI